MARMFTKISKALGPELTLRHLAILESVAAGNRHVRTIATDIGVSKPIVSRALNALPHLLRRMEDPEDMRSVRVELTKEAKKILDYATVMSKGLI